MFIYFDTACTLNCYMEAIPVGSDGPDKNEFWENEYLERSIVCNTVGTENLFLKHIAFNA